MSDIIDFNEIKNKVRDKDVDELENYIYDLYYEVSAGKMTLADLNREIQKFMDEKGISQEKFMEIQKKLVERYGYNAEELEASFMGQQNLFIEKEQQNQGFRAKYGKALSDMRGYRMDIKNERNEVVLFCSDTSVFIMSGKNVDLEDNELNEFLVSYKKQSGNQKLNVILAANSQYFEF